MEAEVDVLPEAVPPTRRRRHSKEFKAQAIRAAMQPNISIAAVALHYRLNANLLRNWVAHQEELDAAAEIRKSMNAPSAEFVPLQLETTDISPGAQEIQIEVRRGTTTINIRWPMCAAGGKPSVKDVLRADQWCGWREDRMFSLSELVRSPILARRSKEADP